MFEILSENYFDTESFLSYVVPEITNSVAANTYNITSLVILLFLLLYVPARLPCECNVCEYEAYDYIDFQQLHC